MEKIIDSIKNVFKNKPRSLPEKIWCFYPDPYRKGLAATALTATVISLSIILVFLIIALISLGLYLLAIILYAVASAALLAFGLSGGYSAKYLKDSWVPLGLFLFTGYCAAQIALPIMNAIGGIWNFAQSFAGNLQYFSAFTDFISGNFLILLGVIILPALAVAVVAGVTMTIVYTLRFFEKGILWFHGIRQPCPVCSEKTEPAKYFCKSCGTEHKETLIPSQYGVLRHHCANCNDTLPTMLLFSKKRELPHRCKNCNHEIKAGVVGKDKHIAFVGGQSSGKTCLLIKTVQELMEKKGVIPEVEQERDFQKLLRLMEQGQVPPKTQKKNDYRAFQVALKKGRFPYHFYFYDIAGENFEDATDTRAQRFFRTVESIVFVFDPYAIHSFSKKQGLTGKFQHASQDPLDILRNLVQGLEKFNSRNKRTKNIFLNIMLVKTDTGYLPPLQGAQSATKSALLRQFLQEDLDQRAFTDYAEHHFTKVSYHCVSALGRIPSPSDTSPFEPENLSLSLNEIYRDVKITLPA